MFLELDGNGPQYAQLTRAMKSAILGGRMPAGSRLPPTRILARELELSRTTVLAAYEQLRAEGFIDARVGSGSYVATLQLTPSLRPVTNTTDAAASRYAERARQFRERRIARLHFGLRYDLRYGDPLTNPALNAAWGRELARAAAYSPLTVTGSWGLPALRQQICEYLAQRRGLQAQPDDILIVTGTQQAYALCARVLLDEGDTVVLEEPHYFGAYHAMVAHGAKLCPVRTDDDGLVCSELPEVTPKLVCVTPSHQFPTGAVLSLPRRLELLRYAARMRCWIVEDDYDGEFRYDAHPLAALRSLDEGDRVIYAGTFSKTLFGALRLGYMVLPAALRDDFITAKYISDVSSPGIEQAALAHYMQSGGFERHLRHARKELQARREALITGLHRHAGERVQVVHSPAGMHVAVWLNGYDHARAEALIAYAHERGLGLYPMAPHYLEPPQRPGLLLGFCSLSVTELREAMRLLGDCMDELDKLIPSGMVSHGNNGS
ncbi:Transcriptional regulator [Rhodanobacter sp. Root179]|uniref:MocR-like pyridoxine biosynthesis transcription factor PdxR n=1 Tax=Rhodanobacter sp. Root179 TaxID=1736482 RepID=UPI000B07EAF7|nr:PLP-dependent aminotransferase family protein [Rhodanobacter sp. Root179]